MVTLSGRVNAASAWTLKGTKTMIQRINREGTIEGLSFDYVLVTPTGAETVFGRTMKVYSVEFKDGNGATVKSFDRLDRKTINNSISRLR